MSLSTPELIRAIAQRSARVRAECLDVCSEGCSIACDECFRSRMEDEPSLLDEARKAAPEVSELHRSASSRSA